MQQIDQLLNQTQNKKLLIMFPHPDDETVMAAGLIQRAISLGYSLKVITVTNGAMGQVHVHGNGRSVSQIRRLELELAMQTLGVTDWEKWRYFDGGLSETTNWQEQVAETIKEYNPGIVVTYDPSGISGHPDHISLGKTIYSELLNKPEVILLWPTFDGSLKEWFKDKTKTFHLMPTADYQLTLTTEEVVNKLSALKAHLSQDLSSPVEWLQQHPGEYFAVADKTNYHTFEIFEYDLGD